MQKKKIVKRDIGVRHNRKRNEIHLIANVKPNKSVDKEITIVADKLDVNEETVKPNKRQKKAKEIENNEQIDISNE